MAPLCSLSSRGRKRHDTRISGLYLQGMVDVILDGWGSGVGAGSQERPRGGGPGTGANGTSFRVSKPMTGRSSGARRRR